MISKKGLASSFIKYKDLESFAKQLMQLLWC